MAQWASIETADGGRIGLTDADVLWAARMAAFEGGNPADSLWAVTQRAASFRRGFASTARAFSQPINPLWLRDGACCCGPGSCPKGRNFCGDDRFCSERQYERRRLAQSASMEQLRRIDPAAVQATLSWAKAELSNPVPRAVDFATPPIARSFVERNPGSKIIKTRGNAFIATQSSRQWPKNYVVMRLGDRVAGESEVPIAAVAMVAGLGVLGYALWRRRGRLGAYPQTLSLPDPHAAKQYREVLFAIGNLRGVGAFEDNIAAARKAILADAAQWLEMPARGVGQRGAVEARLFQIANRAGLAQ